MADGVEGWIEKKYNNPAKMQLRSSLFGGQWQYELVVHRVRFPEELAMLRARGITIHQLDDIAGELASGQTLIQSAAGGELLELILLGRG